VGHRRVLQPGEHLLPGRGSAANSAVCYALGVTKADAVSLGLLFERFLSPERDGPPDIDLDIESDRREEVIQYVYERYGRHHTAQVANVITYRARSSVRDMAKALGFAPGQQDAWSKQIDAWGPVASTTAQPDHDIPPGGGTRRRDRGRAPPPRHPLGRHGHLRPPGDRGVPGRVGRMEDRSVLQWDKDDCAAAGLVKFDLLGLGMLSALHYAVDLIREHRGYEVDLATIPQEDDVYAMLCRADTVGVFQIESRAQMATLPRLKPRRFYDLVVEVALIRPGPIQGGSVHPYIRRRNGQEPVTYLHPLLENSLARRWGAAVPGAADADGDRRRRVHAQRGRPAAPGDGLEAQPGAHGAAEAAAVRRHGRARHHRRGRRRDLHEDGAFANYGFPESHSCRSPTWCTRRRGSSTTSRRRSARRCSTRSRWGSGARTRWCRTPAATAWWCTRPTSTRRSRRPRSSRAPTVGGVDVRLGLSSVRGIGLDLARSITLLRTSCRRYQGRSGPRLTQTGYTSIEDLVRRVPELTLPDAARGDGHRRRVRAHASGSTGARRCGGGRGGAVAPGSARGHRGDRGGGAARLPGMDVVETAVADLWATGMAPNGHPTQFLREAAAARRAC
jgi:error-prone DNA polymerase